MTRRLVDVLLCTGGCGLPVDLAWSRRTGLTAHPGCTTPGDPAPATEPAAPPAKPTPVPRRVGKVGRPAVPEVVTAPSSSTWAPAAGVGRTRLRDGELEAWRTARARRAQVLQRRRAPQVAPDRFLPLADRPGMGVRISDAELDRLAALETALARRGVRR